MIDLLRVPESELLEPDLLNVELVLTIVGAHAGRDSDHEPPHVPLAPVVLPMIEEVIAPVR